MASTSTCDEFGGHYRKEAKTSFVRSPSGAIAPAKKFSSLADLLAWLPSDAAMRAAHGKLIVRPGDEAAAKKAPGKRVSEEQHNVEVVAFIHHVKHEDDCDFHVIVGSSPQAANATFFNVEVSGLPGHAAKDFTRLEQVRQQLKTLIGQPIPKTKYHNVSPPMKVHIRGSVFFDADHFAGTIGPGADKPQTVWEIHPVMDLTAA